MANKRLNLDVLPKITDARIENYRKILKYFQTDFNDVLRYKASYVSFTKILRSVHNDISVHKIKLLKCK